MPINKKNFAIPYDNLSKIIDVDDSVGRSVPINMNFTDEGYLTKDEGITKFGNFETEKIHSLFNYKKRDGISHFLSAKGNKLRIWNYKKQIIADNVSNTLFSYQKIEGEATITIASASLVTLNNHGLVFGDTVQFKTTGTLPTGLSLNTDYYVIGSGLGTNTFSVSSTRGGSAVTTTGTQSGVHSVVKTTNRGHNFTNGTEIYLLNTNISSLPSNLAKNTPYFVVNATTYTFQLSLTLGGGVIDFTDDGAFYFYAEKVNGTWEDLNFIYQNGENITFTAGEEFGYIVYNDKLYFCNSVEPFFEFNGSDMMPFHSIPKGNILEIYEDRCFVSGVKSQPLVAYYSDAGNMTTGYSNFVSPLGTDSIQVLRNYYGTLMVFKTDSIWKITFQYNQAVDAFQPKVELQSNNYGACSKKAVSWVENDIWFFTGREVRSIGFKDNQIGVFGVNQSVISEPIKETLKIISVNDFSKVSVSYYERKFFLGIPLLKQNVNTIFVCHTLYGNSWTKYENRLKSNVNDYVTINDIVYSTSSIAPFCVYKWGGTLNDIDQNSNIIPVKSEVFFKRTEAPNFNVSRVYRYLNLMFKDLQGIVNVIINEEKNGSVLERVKSFYVGNDVEGELNSTGEVNFGSLLVADSYGENIKSSPFVKRKISFLSKSQSFIIGLINERLNEKFTISKMVLEGFEEPTKQYKSSNIISM